MYTVKDVITALRYDGDEGALRADNRLALVERTARCGARSAVLEAEPQSVAGVRDRCALSSARSSAWQQPTHEQAPTRRHRAALPTQGLLGPHRRGPAKSSARTSSAAAAWPRGATLCRSLSLLAARAFFSLHCMEATQHPDVQHTMN